LRIIWWSGGFKSMNEQQVIDELVEYCRRRAEESGIKGGYYEKIAEQLANKMKI